MKLKLLTTALAVALPVTLKFSDGTSHDLTVPVKAFTEEEEHYHPTPTPNAK